MAVLSFFTIFAINGFIVTYFHFIQYALVTLQLLYIMAHEIARKMQSSNCICLNLFFQYVIEPRTALTAFYASGRLLFPLSITWT